MRRRRYGFHRDWHARAGATRLAPSLARIDHRPDHGLPRSLLRLRWAGGGCGLAFHFSGLIWAKRLGQSYWLARLAISRDCIRLGLPAQPATFFLPNT